MVFVKTAALVATDFLILLILLYDAYFWRYVLIEVNYVSISLKDTKDFEDENGWKGQKYKISETTGFEVVD